MQWRILQGVPAEDVQRLLQPFQRLAPDRTGTGDGLGLGLSIVAAIATAHDAVLDIKPREHGGLSVEARFRQARDQAPTAAAGSSESFPAVTA